MGTGTDAINLARQSATSLQTAALRPEPRVRASAESADIVAVPPDTNV